MIDEEFIEGFEKTALTTGTIMKTVKKALEREGVKFPKNIITRLAESSPVPYLKSETKDFLKKYVDKVQKARGRR